MGYINKITITDNGTHLIEPTLYAVASGTASAITASIDGFEAVSGVIIYIKMTANNAANATLNINSSTARDIYYNDSKITAGKLASGRTYGFAYDGTSGSEKWILIGDSLDYVLKSGDNMTGNLNFSATNSTLANAANKGVFWQDNSDNTLGFIKSNSSGAIGIAAKNNIVLRPVRNTDFSSTDGIVITDTAFYPDWETGSMSLGLGTKLWDMTWANGGYFGQKLGTANYQLRVNGGFISAGDNTTGALQIKLPPIGSTMVQFKVILYNYVSAGYATYYIHGRTFTSDTSNWVRTQAYSEGVGPTRNLAVRFYTDITTSPHTPMVIIGETTTTWDYPRAIITEVYANQTFTNYTDNWNMSFITTLPVTEGDNITAIGPGDEYYPAGTLLGKGVNIFVKSADFIRTVDSTTINNTSGTFFFNSTQKIAQIPESTSSTNDWVGLQVGSSADKWQLTAIGNSLYFRQNDSGGTNTANWSTWTKMLDATNYKSYAWARPDTITDRKVIISDGTDGDTTLQAITDNTTAGTAITASTNLVTANTIANWSGSSNISTVGTISSGTWEGTAITAANGGTGQSSYVLGDILYASDTTTLSKLSGNTTSTKKFLSMTGTGSAADAPAWSVLASSDLPSHSHGNITNEGAMSGSTVSGTVSNTDKFLREDGTWTTPAYTVNTDESVKQTLVSTSTSQYYPLLLSKSANTDEEIGQVRKADTVKYNPYSGRFSIYSLILSYDETGSGTSIKNLMFSRPSANYITAPEAGSICFSCTDSSGISLGISTVYITKDALMPGATNTYDLGSSSYKWKDAYFSGALNVGGASNLTGATTIGTSASNSNLTIHGNILPGTTNTHNLGASDNKWANIYATTFTGTLDGNATNVTGTVAVANGGTGVSSFTANSVIMSGNTTTAALTTRGIVNNTSAGAVGWEGSASDAANISLITRNTIAYWNGAYRNTYSNLAYCNRGAFGTIVTKASTDYVSYAGNATAIGDSSPAYGAKTWWANTSNVPRLSVVAAYNNSGTEYAMLFSKGNADSTYGAILKWTYSNPYIFILRNHPSGAYDGWLSDDWEKISAGTADKVQASLAATTKTYLLGTSTTITGTAANVSLSGDTGVYLTTTSGELSTVRYSLNNDGTEKAYITYNTTDDCIDFIFV